MYDRRGTCRKFVRTLKEKKNRKLSSLMNEKADVAKEGESDGVTIQEFHPPPH